MAHRYAASSEKLSPDQVNLFDEAECDAHPEVDEEDDTETISVPAHTRKKRGRKPLPDTLPRVEVIHEIPEDQHHCPHDGQLLQPLINLLRDHLLEYDIVQMDETTVQVLKEPGKTAQSKSYLWLQRGGLYTPLQKRGYLPLFP